LEEQQHLLNMSKAQIEQEQWKQVELEALRQATFARHADDEVLKDIRKNDIHAGDPMATYAARKKKSQKHHPATTDQSSGVVVPQKPVYKGPPAKANRFGIRLGFRWDGVNRGNGFEDKILAKKFSVQHQKEQAY